MSTSTAVEKQKGEAASSLEHRHDVYWLNKITFVISVSAYYLYPALKKAGKWSKVLLGKESGTIPQSSSISIVLWDLICCTDHPFEKMNVLWKKQSCAFTNPLSRLFWNTFSLLFGLWWVMPKTKIKKVEMAAEGPREKEDRRWKRKPTPFGC